MSSIPSPGSLALHSDTSSCRAALTAGLYFFHGTRSVPATGREKGGGFPGASSALFTGMVRGAITAVMQSNVSVLRRRPFASCVVGRERAARFSPAEGYHAL